jgi:Tol biopolymer transport system component
VDSLPVPGTDPCSEQEIREELNRLVSSREFAQAGRLCRFLTFVVERTLAGDRESLKESVIGTAVYDRAPGYDPKAEPIVRTEARRLRAKLADYYQNTGRDDRIFISVPTGGYVASFEPRREPAMSKLAVLPKPPALEAEPTVPIRRQAEPVRYIRWAAAVLVVLAAAGALLLRRAGNSRTYSEFALMTVTSYPGAQYTPAISPDGRQVVFAWSADKSGADLYMVSADGGVPKRLTTAHSGDNFPAWSHDGTQIAFIRANTLMVVSPSGGGERALGPAFPSWLSWSPTANVLFVSDWVPGRHVLGLFAVDEATGSRRQVTFPPAGITGDTAGALSPDGNRLAFIRCNLANCDIYAVTYGRAEPQRLTHDECSFAGLSWMPDGRSIVFSSRRRGAYMLWQVNSSGGNPEQVAASGVDVRAPRAVRALSGKVRIVFDHRVNIGNIWRQQLNPQATQKRAPNPAARLIASTRLDSSPQISPDGKKIVFASDRTGYPEIWAADADGTNQRPLTHLRESAGSPRWSQDGNRIAFDLLTRNGRAIFLTDINGAAPQQWTQWGAAARPSWSRDGRWIYFGSDDSGGKPQVWKISTAPDRSTVQVTHDGGFEAFESPDGGTLFYTRGTELLGMPVSGGPGTRVTTQTVRPGWWSVSQNGIYFADIRLPKADVYDEPFPVLLLDPQSGQTRQAATIPGPVYRSTPDFTTSPDGKTLYYCLLEVSTSQIRMVESL